MDKAKVYYCDFTATADCNLLQIAGKANQNGRY